MKKLIENYITPSVDDIAKLKETSSFTGNGMAALAPVSGNSQWCKYTGRQSPRAIFPHIVFFITMQLSLSDEKLNSTLNKIKRLVLLLNNHSLIWDPVLYIFVLYA